MTPGTHVRPAPRGSSRRRRTRLIVTAAVVPLTVAGIAFATGTPARATPTTDHTSPAEASLVDQIPTPVLNWTPCQQSFQCATANLPRDYHHPHGPAVSIALLRLPATDPAHRLDSVFVSPGGPGDAGTDFVAQNASFLPESLLDRFDVIGVDPRGVGASQPIRCFADQAKQTQVESTLDTQHFPTTPADQHAWITAAQAFGRDCSTLAKPLKQRNVAERCINKLTGFRGVAEVLAVTRELTHVIVHEPAGWATGGPDEPRYVVRVTVPGSWNTNQFGQHMIPRITAIIGEFEDDPGRLARQPHCIVQIIGLKEHSAGTLGRVTTSADITRLITEGYRGTPKQAAAGNTLDPVCGMTVDLATATRTIEHEGATYAFCAPARRKVFAQDHGIPV